MLLCLTLLACSVVPAFAQFPIPAAGQLSLGWGECNGPATQVVACQDPAALDQLYASLTSMQAVDGVIADLGIIDVTAGLDPTALPPFWDFHLGGCSGPTNLLFSADFTANLVCYDLWGGLAGSGGQYGGPSGPTPEGNRARIKWTSNVTPDQARSIVLAPQMMYIERIVVRHNSLSTCPGCQEAVCFVYNEELLSDIHGNQWRFTNPGYATANAPPTAINCPGSTPTQAKTWGQVKSLYK